VKPTSHTRTRQYTRGLVPGDPVSIIIGESIHTYGGQMAVMAACNAIVRNHPVVYVLADDIPILAAHTRAMTTHRLLTKIGTATDTSKVEIVDTPPPGLPSIGIGPDVSDAAMYIGANRFTGLIATEPADITPDPSSAWGAALAAMLAANAVFRTAISVEIPRPAPLSLWTIGSIAAGAATGPADPGPIDVGSVWLIGAGGVGSSLAWWLSLLGVHGDWTVIDHERVDITNLNRSLGMFHAEFGTGDEEAAFKADVAGRLIGAHAFPHQWADWATTDPAPPDVVIPAANDFGVRGGLAAYSHPMALTGTTSRSWTAELHLYRAGTDGCIDCRHPASPSASFVCSTSPVPAPGGGSTDAALSFLSGTAGLLAAAALARLQAGELTEQTNHWQVAFQPARRPVTPNRHGCVGGQPHALDDPTRHTLYGHTRWAT
jgi:molybdopterin/thiamine biosynthesis adenylyltransferase